MDTRSASCRWSSLIASRDGFDFRLACGAGAVGVGALAGGAVGVLELADSSADVDAWSELMRRMLTSLEAFDAHPGAPTPRPTRRRRS